ncbi:MAG TPA: 4Fe-4S binding protein [Anaerolineae bacterium]|nr:4Fe-4S binding protein [Anaerolineae bacterium]
MKITAPSGYAVLANAEKCNVCGKCEKVCPYDAMKIVQIEEKKELSYYKDQCMGCGVCISFCPNGALSLVVDPDKGKIFDVDSLIELFGTRHQASG